ncbi:glycosyltransferase family 4 protein [Haloechinothrix salitolerans]|uniref:Glycosyltransferase family 4 protein n=1 Tax=Haloechinothrix salitolerans TaxID=926830 RepID=A0ABW2BY91_9PSEU
MTTTFALVVPSGIDEVPTGGNVYDRRMRDGLTAAGLDVREISVPGAWPRPVPADRAALARSLDALPDGTPVLLDGLVACGVPEVVVPRASRLRLAILVHMPLADDVGLPRTVATELARRERETLAAVTMVVATSEATARRLREEYGPRAVDVVPPGVDSAPRTTGSDTGARLLCVASVAPVKGQDVLVAALARLAGLTWHCRCAGAVRDPGFADRVRDEIERRGLGNRMELMGARGPEEMAQLYGAADLLVLPSRAESYGMVVAEALARGIPVAASAVGGVREALGDTDLGRPGLLVTPDDAVALADALRMWLTDTALRQRLRAAALRRGETLEPWSVAAGRLAAVLRRLVAAEVTR